MKKKKGKKTERKKKKEREEGVREGGSYRDRETKRDRDRQTDRHRGRETDRDRDREREREGGRGTHIRPKQNNKQTNKARAERNQPLSDPSQHRRSNNKTSNQPRLSGAHQTGEVH